MKRLIVAILTALGLLLVGAGPALAAPPAPSGIVGPGPIAPLPGTGDKNGSAGQYLTPGEAPTVNGPVVQPTAPAKGPPPADPLGCTSPPGAAMPGRGLSGFIDSGPAKGHADTGTSVYAKYGYPPPYATYDLGCGGEARDVWASLDTWMANQITGAATVLVALANSLHRMVSPPTGFLAPLDPLIDKGRKALQDALYTPYLGLSLVVLAIVLLLAARRQDLPGVVRGTGWALAVITMVAGLGIYTQQAAHVSDGITTATVGTINQHMLGEDPNTSGDPAAVRGALLTDSVLYRQWLRGEFGNPDSSVATKYGKDLLDSLTFSYAEDVDATVSGNPNRRTEISNAKRGEFVDIAWKVHDEDPAAYRALQGKAEQRLGAAWVALLAAGLTVPFLVAADILILAALVIIRLAVTFFPALAVVGLHEATSEVVKGTGKAVFAALINSIVFSAGAAVNALAIKVLLSDVPLGTNMLGRLLLCGLVTTLLWFTLKPYRRLTHMVSPRSPIHSGADEMRGAGRRFGRGIAKLAGVAVTGTHGAGDADEDETSSDEMSDDKQRPEAQSRPEQVGDADDTVRDGAPVWKFWDPKSRTYVDAESSGDAQEPDPYDWDPWAHAWVNAEQRPRPGSAQPYRSTPQLDSDGHSVHQIWDPDTKQYTTAKDDPTEH